MPYREPEWMGPKQSVAYQYLVTQLLVTERINYLPLCGEIATISELTAPNKLLYSLSMFGLLHLYHDKRHFIESVALTELGRQFVTQ